MFDAIVVMKRETLQEIVPLGKGDTKLILLKMMNQPTKKRVTREKDDLDEEYVLTAVLMGTPSHEER